MYLIVDKMPNEPKECIFSECTNQLRDSYVCKLHQGRGCEPDRCQFLRPILGTYMPTDGTKKCHAGKLD